jgi:hypothetical protein
MGQARAMSNADDIKRPACFPRLPVSRACSSRWRGGINTTERRFGQRALNGVFRPRSPPHLTSEPLRGNLRAKQPLRRAFFEARFMPPAPGPNCQVISSQSKNRPRFFRSKSDWRWKFFAHSRGFHATERTSGRSDYMAEQGITQRDGCKLARSRAKKEEGLRREMTFRRTS